MLDQSPPKPESFGPARTGLYLRTTAAYMAWVGRLTRHCRKTIADAVVDALALLATDVGFTEPPPSRVGDARRAGRKVEPAPQEEVAAS